MKKISLVTAALLATTSLSFAQMSQSQQMPQSQMDTMAKENPVPGNKAAGSSSPVPAPSPFKNEFGTVGMAGSQTAKPGNVSGTVSGGAGGATATGATTGTR